MESSHQGRDVPNEDNATAQAKLLLGPSRCLSVEPSGADADIEMDDYERAFEKLPELAAKHFETHKDNSAIFPEISCSA